MGFAPADIFWMTWVEFSENTGVAGASNVGRAKEVLRKCIWFCIFVFGLVMTVISLIQVIESYREFDVDTDLSLNQKTSV